MEPRALGMLLQLIQRTWDERLDPTILYTARFVPFRKTNHVSGSSEETFPWILACSNVSVIPAAKCIVVISVFVNFHSIMSRTDQRRIVRFKIIVKNLGKLSCIDRLNLKHLYHVRLCSSLFRTQKVSRFVNLYLCNWKTVSGVLHIIGFQMESVIS